MEKFLSGQRILIVEDEMLVLLMIEGIMADLGCVSVTAAATVSQALALIGAQGFDAAMLDVNLNGDRSYPVADALGERGVPFAFSTGYGGHAVTEPYRGRPMLKKPFHAEELAAVFKSFSLGTKRIAAA